MPLPFYLIICGHPILSYLKTSFVFPLLAYTNCRSIFSSFHHFFFLPDMSQEAELRPLSKSREGEKDCTNRPAPYSRPPGWQPGPTERSMVLKAKGYEFFTLLWCLCVHLIVKSLPSQKHTVWALKLVYRPHWYYSECDQFHRFYYLSQERTQMGRNPRLWLYPVTVWGGENTCHFLELTLQKGHVASGLSSRCTMMG